MSSPKHIAIVGGGPGGLSLARLLQLGDKAHRYVVKVYERDVNAQARIEGGSLDLHVGSGQDFIDKAELRAAYEEVSRVDGGYYAMYTQQLEKVWDLAVPQHPEMDRSDLRTMLLDSLQPDTVEWDHHLLKIGVEGDKYALWFKHNQESPVYCDIVIGADGAMSKVRTHIAPTMAKPTYSGVTLIQGEVLHPDTQCPSILSRINRGNMFILGSQGRHFGLQQKTDGSIIYYASFKVPEHFMEQKYGIHSNEPVDQAAFRLAMLDIFEGFDQEILDVIKVTDRLVVRKATGLMYRSTLEGRWTNFGERKRPLATLIGDAAHVMPSFSGQGVNNAMMDAVELAEELLKDQDCSLAFSAYEQRMLARCIPAAQKTEEFEDAFHDENDNIAAVTKGFIKLAPIKLDDKWKYLLD